MDTQNLSGRDRILAVAERLFTERGYQAVSIRDIAQACQVTNAALYYYFPSKEAMFVEVMDQHAHRLNAMMERAGAIAGALETIPGVGAGDSPDEHNRQRVQAMLSAYAHLTAERRSPFFLLRREAPEMDEQAARDHMARLMQALLKPLDDALNEAINAGELQVLPPDTSAAALLVGMLHGLVQHRKACHQGVHHEEDINLVVDIFWRGLQVDNTTETLNSRSQLS